MLGVPPWDAERPGVLAQQQGPLVEISADHDVSVIELASDQPAVIPPLGKPLPHGATHTSQSPGKLIHIADNHLRGLPDSS